MSYYSSPPTKQQQPPRAPPSHARSANFTNMHPQHGGLYPAAAAHLEHLQQQQHQQQQFAHFQQQHLAMGAQPIPLAPAMPQQAFAEEAMLAAQNISVQNMAAPNLVPQNLPSQTMPVQNGAMDDHSTPVDEEIADLGGIGLQELLHGINPQMFGDLQTQAPDVIALLRKTNSLNNAPTSTQASAINMTAAAAAAAAANSSPIDPDAITSSPIASPSTMPHMTAHNMQPAPTDAYPYLAGMVDAASSPLMHAQLNVSSALGSMPASVTTGVVPPQSANGHRANGGRNDVVAAAAAAASAAAAAAAVGKSSRPRVGLKRSKAEQQTSVKQELTPLGGMYDANGGMTNGGTDIDLSEASENNEVRKAMRAERNRQSAAASRERKKNHIKELERRVAALSQQNAKLQVEQLDAIRIRIVEEQRLLDENKMLRKDGVMKDLKIQELTNKLEKAGLEPQPQRAAIQELYLKRPSTWGSSTWSASKWGMGAGTK